MPLSESQKPLEGQSIARRFALGTSLFYASTLGLGGAYLPFFPVWLKAIGIDAAWIGIITAVPSFTRFTVLPFVTAFAEHRRILRGTMVVLAAFTAVGFALLGLLQQPLPILIAFALTACAWTPLTDGYALKGVVRHGLDYGPMRLWGSAAFIVGALVSGLLLRAIDSTQLIWPIAALAVLCALASFALVPLDAPPAATQPLSRARGLLRKPLFLAIIAASALIQGSHAAYYAFSSITWQAAGLGGGTIAALWSLGVIAEIVVFAVSPRFTWSPASLVLIGAASGVVRWIVTAQEPGIALLAGVQLLHGFTFGITQVGIVALMAQRVPQHLLASAQGYLAAASGAAMSLSTIVSGLLYAQVGEGVYLAMALMALAGGGVIGWARPRLAAVHAI